MSKLTPNHLNSVEISQETNAVLNNFLVEKFASRKKVILTDDNVFEYWIEQLVTSVDELRDAEIIQLPAGEETKCIEIAVQVWETLTDYKIERGDLIINFGGGMITDLGGFVASLYKRGISFVNIPTSLLAQVDASLGGKTGIDLGPYKNQIGTFNQADLVLVNPLYLSTLPQNELKSGYGEMLKHGLILSKQHWNELKSIDYHQTESLTKLIFDSIALKNKVVSEDPKEAGGRKALNFGHTVGHAIEGYFLQNGNPIKHGFAVAWGLAIEAYLSFKTGLLDKKQWDEIHYVITDIFPPLKLKASELNTILQLMKNDKKNNDGKINFTLLTGIGSHKIDQYILESDIKDALNIIAY